MVVWMNKPRLFPRFDPGCHLAGAYYGESGIPVSWLGKLAMRDLIVSLAERLAVAGREGGQE